MAAWPNTYTRKALGALRAQKAAARQLIEVIPHSPAGLGRATSYVLRQRCCAAEVDHLLTDYSRAAV